MILEKLVEILPDMDFCGVDENVFKFYGTYEEDFSYTFTISTLAKGKYLVVINLYTNTRFPVREFRVRVDNLESISKLSETVLNNCMKLSKMMDNLVEAHGE